MFNPFKRSPPAPEKPKKTNARNAQGKSAARSAQALPAPLHPPPLPEVQEGNDVTDWALWEDSVIALDSQMQNLTPSARIYERAKEPPSEYQDVDPFSSVNRKSK